MVVKQGMDPDLNTGQRQVGEIRDKLKSKTVSGSPIKISIKWSFGSWALASMIMAMLLTFTVSFFNY